MIELSAIRLLLLRAFAFLILPLFFACEGKVVNSRDPEDAASAGSAKSNGKKVSDDDDGDEEILDLALGISGAPSAISNSTNLDIDISATGLKSYRYKIGLAGSTDCASEGGYSNEIDASVHITDSIASFADGTLKLCIVGKATSGDWEDFESATESTWTKDTTLVVSARYPSASAWNKYVDAPDTTSSFSASLKKHAGEQKKVSTGVSSCSGLSMSDALGVFDWICKIESNEAIFYSKLKTGKGLRDLINHGSPNGSWKSNSVTISGRAGSNNTSASTVWWSNTIEPLADSGSSFVTISSGNEGKIYTINADVGASLGINIDSDEVAVVVIGNSTTITSGIAGNNCNASAEIASPTTTCLLAVGSQSRVWVEGGIWDGVLDTTTANVVSGFTNNQLVLRNLTIHSGDFGINLNSNFQANLNSIKIKNTESNGILLTSDDRPLLENILVTNSGLSAADAAIFLSSVDEATADSLYLYGNDNEGLEANSSQLWASNIVASQNDQNGMYLNTMTAGSNIWGYTGVNNSASGARVRDGSRLTLLSALTINNVSNGFLLNSVALEHTIAQAAAAHNGTNGIQTSVGSNDSLILGNLFLGNNSGGNCAINSTGMNIATGANNTTCTPSGSLNEVSFAADLSAVIAGKVTSDSNGSSGGGGTAAYSLTNDWFNFDNILRAWGKDSAAFPATGNRGRCASGTCRIWDYSLSSGSTLLRGITGDGSTQNDAFSANSACPSEVNGNQTITNTNGQSFLKSAGEILVGPNRSDSGDHDGLCESGENCFYLPNIGAYQGHGSIGECTFSASGGLTSIRMFGYLDNSGR